jgi:hypothetical protein
MSAARPSSPPICLSCGVDTDTFAFTPLPSYEGSVSLRRVGILLDDAVSHPSRLSG